MFHRLVYLSNETSSTSYRCQGGVHRPGVGLLLQRALNHQVSLLKDVCKLRKQLPKFLYFKGVKFPHFEDATWAYDVALLVDRTIHLNNLNRYRDGKCILVPDITLEDEGQVM